MSRALKKSMPKAPPLQQEEERGEEDQDVVEGAEGAKATGEREISVTELANLLRSHMARTDGRETARQQEQADQERRFKALQPSSVFCNWRSMHAPLLILTNLM